MNDLQLDTIYQTLIKTFKMWKEGYSILLLYNAEKEKVMLQMCHLYRSKSLNFIGDAEIFVYSHHLNCMNAGYLSSTASPAWTACLLPFPLFNVFDKYM